MAKPANTHRQKDIARLLRDRRKAYPEKIKARLYLPVKSSAKGASCEK